VLAVGIEVELPAGPDGIPAVPTDDAFHLLPGETRDVDIAWRAVPDAERGASVRAWNAPAVAA
jgi:hypothetical protein